VSSSDRVEGTALYNTEGKKLGSIDDLMIDNARIAIPFHGETTCIRNGSIAITAIIIDSLGVVAFGPALARLSRRAKVTFARAGSVAILVPPQTACGPLIGVCSAQRCCGLTALCFHRNGPQMHATPPPARSRRS
jgi:hypothetical protein